MGSLSDAGDCVLFDAQSFSPRSMAPSRWRPGPLNAGAAHGARTPLPGAQPHQRACLAADSRHDLLPSDQHLWVEFNALAGEARQASRGGALVRFAVVDRFPPPQVLACRAGAARLCMAELARRAKGGRRSGADSPEHPPRYAIWAEPVGGADGATSGPASHTSPAWAPALDARNVECPFF